MTRIEHKSSALVVPYQLDYAWNLDNTIYSRLETDNTVTPSVSTTVTFTYDSRKRLTRELRVRAGAPPVTEYDLNYFYDQLGNRTSLVSATNNKSVAYFYDADPANRDPSFQTNNNRLIWYEERTGGALTRKVSYTYYRTGDASNISIRDVGDVDAGGKQVVHDLAMYYVRNGMLALSYSGTWKETGLVQNFAGTWQNGTPDLASYSFVGADEFRYDSPRARYLRRALRITGPGGSPTADPRQPCFAPRTPDESIWTDYVGDSPYLDYTVDVSGGGLPYVTELTRHAPHAEQDMVTGGTPTRYFHDDLVGSTVLGTESTGGVANPAPKLAYTAFGEERSIGGAALNTRYRYVGAHGYESDLLVLDGKAGTASASLQHVGARWYQANIGRFVQRDPIGLRGGANLYLYTENDAMVHVDPEGLAGGPPNPYHPRDFWEQMKILNRGIAKQAKLTRLTDVAARSTALSRLYGLIKNRNLLFLQQYGPLCIGLAIDALVASEPYVHDTIDGMRDGIMVGRMRMGGFTDGEIRDYLGIVR